MAVGNRKGAGRPKGTGRYGEPTVPVRVPLSLVEKVREVVEAGGRKRPLYVTSLPSDVGDGPVAVLVGPRCQAGLLVPGAPAGVVTAAPVEGDALGSELGACLLAADVPGRGLGKDKSRNER